MNGVSMTDSELREFVALSPDTSSEWARLTEEERARWLHYRRAVRAGLFDEQHDPTICGDCIRRGAAS